MDYNMLIAKELPMAIEVNQPQKKPRSNHVTPLLFTILLVACVAVGIYLFVDGIIPIGGVIGMCVGSYVLYLIFGVCVNKTAKYLNNSKSFQEYEDFYYHLKESKAYFRFDVECYHYENNEHHGDSNYAHQTTKQSSNPQQRKVVTHKATENMFPAQCQDISGHIEQLYQNSELIFFKYLPRFQFDNLNSQRFFENSFANFKMMNNRDVLQNAKYSFVIPELVERVSFFTGQKQSSAPFYVLGLVGLVYPYCLYKENKISRYEINIVKRISF